MRNSRLRGQAENPNGRNAAEMVNVFRVLTCYEEYCSAGVVEIVGPDLGQFRSLWEGLEVAAERVGAARGGGCDGREDKIVVLPELRPQASLRTGGSGGAFKVLWPFGSTLRSGPCRSLASRRCVRSWSGSACVLPVGSRKVRSGLCHST